MRHQPAAPIPKASGVDHAWRPLPRAAVHRRLERERPEPVPVPNRFGHDFTRVGLRPAEPLGHRNATQAPCPNFPQRCPFGGACHLCPPRLQAKLKIGPAGDRYEQEADRVAERVVAGNPASLTGTAPPGVQRTAPNPAAGSAAPAIVHRALASPGRPMEGALRQGMEQRFGHDFEEVRIHADGTATESAREVNALAYTVGRHIVFQAAHYRPQSPAGQRLLAHELTHVVQQTGGAPLGGSRVQPKCTACGPGQGIPLIREEEEKIIRRRIEDEDELNISRTGIRLSGTLQRAGDPAAIPTGFPCPTDLAPGRPAGTDVAFATGEFAITPAHTILLNTFVTAWTAAGGTDDILVHGYASEPGDQGDNWTLSCNRAEAVKAELVRLGIPDVRIEVVAHGESTDFGAGSTPNEHAVVSSSPGGILPLAFGTLTPHDNFAGRSLTRFGVGETVDLGFGSFPARPAADFGGLEWHLASGTGTLTGVTAAGTGTYTAPATASAERLELRVAAGATAGRVVSAHPIAVVEPSAVNMTVVPGTAPDFAGVIAAGTWGAGFHANVFVDPKDVSFQGVVFGEGTVAGAVTGSFLSGRAGLVHPANTFGPGHAGNAATGTPVSPPVDNIATAGGVAPTRAFGIDFCGVSTFLWAIPWEFSVAGGPRTPFAGGFTANHRIVSSLLCTATIDKAGAGPFCRNIDGTVC
jgi:outer membrane protein OmpA-like peptidoglycan-associated protein